MSQSAPAQDIHVLIIDDCPEALKPLSNLIRSAGIRLSVITEPRQAVQRVQALRPDLILLDVHMSQMDGFAVCRLLQEAPLTREIPIIFLTSASAIEQRLQGLTLGGVDYVIKPFVSEEVLARIRIHVQRMRRDSGGEPEPDGAEASHQDPDQTALHAAMRLIAQQLEAPPGLSDIARQVGTHDKKLSAIFRQYLGMTVFAFIREERLRKSQQLLADSHLSIQDIADLVGFRSAANFATAFRERTGMTPSAFRRQQGEPQHAPD
ncbi:response regulator [Pseudomonas sp. MYb185]|uniref:response regulator transcription factor n=1 Tax=Pseudomonas sp. MYb185 TaxID=1848729 RepID=UPI000CFDAB43|nr:response regulator [Pseudomonas sp. MYb185]PRB82890.1 DNA-binding response regulator [Pseudomonas sp. MYb185]